MKRSSRLVLLVLVAAQFGCGPKLGEVLKKYEGDFKKKREQLQAIAKSLPPKGSVSEESACPTLSPPLVFDEFKSERSNTAILMFEHLQDPDSKPAFDFYLGGNFLNALAWTGPKNPLSSSASIRGKEMEKDLQAALGYRYLVVNRVARKVEPVAKDEQTFTPGQTSIEVFVVDLSSNAVLCSFALEAKSAPSVSYSYKPNQSKREQLEKFAHSTMWDEARKKLIAGLQRISKGDIQVR